MKYEIPITQKGLDSFHQKFYKLTEVVSLLHINNLAKYRYDQQHYSTFNKQPNN